MSSGTAITGSPGALMTVAGLGAETRPLPPSVISTAAVPLNGPGFNVSILDLDAGVRESLAQRARAAGYTVQTFSSVCEFVAQHDPAVPGCSILDLSVAEMSGGHPQANPAARGQPVIFITGGADIRASVRAMKSGAVDVLTKPVNEDALLAAVALAAEREAKERRRSAEISSVKARLAKLTPRELDVLRGVISGRLNKQIAADLGRVEKTVKVHRGHVMKKMHVRSVAELVRLIHTLPDQLF